MFALGYDGHNHGPTTTGAGAPVVRRSVEGRSAGDRERSAYAGTRGGGLAPRARVQSSPDGARGVGWVPDVTSADQGARSLRTIATHPPSRWITVQSPDRSMSCVSGSRRGHTTTSTSYRARIFAQSRWPLLRSKKS